MISKGEEFKCSPVVPSFFIACRLEFPLLVLSLSKTSLQNKAAPGLPVPRSGATGPFVGRRSRSAWKGRKKKYEQMRLGVGFLTPRMPK